MTEHISIDTEVHSSFISSFLRLKDIQLEHRGVYTCVVTDNKGTVARDSVNVTVERKQTVQSRIMNVA